MSAPVHILETKTSKNGKTYRVSTIRIREEDYETMVFPGKSWREVDVRRDDNRREARQSHHKLVDKWSD